MNREMTALWQPLGRAPAGGTILQLAAAGRGRLWAASPAGLFHYQEGEWRPAGTLPTAQVGAVVGRGRLVLAAGLEKGAFYSVDAGQTWHNCLMEQITSPVACFAVSPNFTRDATLLAGTQGDGILRSRDGGRIWQLANFGLRSFTVLALAAASTWERREPVFAGTTDGVYYSPNGGRAWKFCGLAGQVVLALALSPEAGTGQTVYAGLEAGGLYRSKDAGQSWQQVALSGALPGEETTINGLACLPGGVVLAATGEQGLLRSIDGGQTWEAVDAPEGILCLALDLSEAAGSRQVLAGAYVDGLWRSLDGGASWEIDAGLAARRFQWLMAAPHAQDRTGGWKAGGWVAGGIDAGIWQVTSAGEAWQALEGWPEDEELLCLAAGAGGLWGGAAAGVWRLDGPQQVFAQVLATGEPVSAVTVLPSAAAQGGQVFAGSAAGRLWHSDQAGTGWQELECPARGAMITALHGAVEAPGRLTLLVIALDAAHNEIQLWQLDAPLENPAAGHWTLWLQERSPWRVAHLAQRGDGPMGRQWVLGLGTSLLVHLANGWKRVEITTPHAPINALLWAGPPVGWLAVAGDSWLTSVDLDHWRRLETIQPQDSSAPGSPVAVWWEGEGQLVCLSTDGRLSRLKIG